MLSRTFDTTDKTKKGTCCHFESNLTDNWSWKRCRSPYEVMWRWQGHLYISLYQECQHTYIHIYIHIYIYIYIFFFGWNFGSKLFIFHCNGLTNFDTIVFYTTWTQTLKRGALLVDFPFKGHKRAVSTLIYVM